MFFHPFPNAFGLNIGDASIKLVQLQDASLGRKKNRYRVSVMRMADLPPGAIVKGELQKPEDVRKKIQELLIGKKGEKKIRGHWVVASLPEIKSFITLLHTPTPPDALLPDDIRSLARHHIPFEDNDYYLDWQIMPPGSVPNRTETAILVGAVPKSSADSFTYLLESLGLGVMALEIEAIAVSRAMVTAGKDYTGDARGILDIGRTHSSFIIYDHSLIQFSTSFSFSGDGITAIVAKNLSLSPEEAEKIKQEQGLSYEKGSAWNALSGLVDQLTADMQKSIDFYHSHFPETNPVTRIILCGGGAYLKGLDAVLTQKLKVEAAPGNPWKNGIQPPKQTPAGNDLSFATAIGASLRAIDNPFLSSRHAI
ncbi:MAG: type IV pilus assembly protein PilM [Patescibacteria group bacterium]